MTNMMKKWPKLTKQEQHAIHRYVSTDVSNILCMSRLKVAEKMRGSDPLLALKVCPMLALCWYLGIVRKMTKVLLIATAIVVSVVGLHAACIYAIITLIQINPLFGILFVPYLTLTIAGVIAFFTFIDK